MKHAKGIKKSYTGKISQAAGRYGQTKLINERPKEKS